MSIILCLTCVELEEIGFPTLASHCEEGKVMK